MKQTLPLYHPFRAWAFPLLLFAIGAFDENLALHLHVPAGTVATFIEIMISLMIFFTARSSLVAENRKFLAIPLCIALGDLAYGYANYLFKLPFPNQMKCLFYIIPYMAAMSFILGALIKMMRKATAIQRHLATLGVIVSLAVFGLISTTIIVPALFYKTPPLSFLLKALTVGFSLLEGPVIGFSIVLLLCAGCGFIQVGLFGVVVMHISDMAIRYQSVNLQAMGMSAFEYGWCLGLTLLLIATRMMQQSQRMTVSPKTSATWLPLSSIRGMTIGFVLVGFFVLWSALSIYYSSIGSALTDASTLLILIFSFAFALIIADFITRHITNVVFLIQNQEEFKKAKCNLFVPREIKIITEHFEKMTKEITTEKDTVLEMTATVTHDLRGPIQAMRSLTSHLLDEAKTECGCKRQLEPYINAMSDALKTMHETADDLLRCRKTVIEGDSIAEAVKKASQWVHRAHRRNQVVMDLPDDIAGPRVQGLSRIITNLLNNAVEASPELEPVFVQVKSMDDGFYQISVKDHGGGIPFEVLRRIERGESVTTKKDGNGLGLPSMVSWAKRQNIKFNFDSVPGEGTEVVLTIPVVSS